MSSLDVSTLGLCWAVGLLSATLALISARLHGVAGVAVVSREDLARSKSIVGVRPLDLNR